MVCWRHLYAQMKEHPDVTAIYDLWLPWTIQVTILHFCLKCYLLCRMKTLCILCPRKPKVQLYHEEGHSLLYLPLLPNSPTLIHTTHNLQFSVLIMKYFQKRNHYLGESMHPVLSILLTTKFHLGDTLHTVSYCFQLLIFHTYFPQSSLRFLWPRLHSPNCRQRHWHAVNKKTIFW